MNYMDALRYIITQGVDEENVRTMHKTRRCFGLSVEYNDGGLFLPRYVNPGLSAAELAWMVMGVQDTTWLKKRCRIWEKFEDSPNRVHSAYGYRWRCRFKRDQLMEAVELLRKDPSSRQALVVAWDPGADGLMNQGKVKNVPCPFAFNLFISQEKVRIVVYQRSADFVAGVPYDLMTHWMLGHSVALELGRDFSGVTVLFGDAHIYHMHMGTAMAMAASLGWAGNKPLKLWSPALSLMMGVKDEFVQNQWGRWDEHFSIMDRVGVAL